MVQTGGVHPQHLPLTEASVATSTTTVTTINVSITTVTETTTETETRVILPTPPLPNNPEDFDPSNYPIWNFGVSTDPVFVGNCRGLISSCYLSGYALETKCRHGSDCMYVIEGARMDISTHRLQWVIDNVLQVMNVPPCIPQTKNCIDCQDWHYFHSK